MCPRMDSESNFGRNSPTGVFPGGVGKVRGPGRSHGESVRSASGGMLVL